MTDQQALQLYARHGDVEAFQHLVRTYQRLVYAACRRHLRDEADVEDAVQETFLKLAENAAKIRRNIAGWLHRCATNASISRIRRDATRRRHELAWVPTDNHEAERSQAIMAEVDAALEELRASDRELILSYYLKGGTQSDLADEQGISRSGLQHRLGRATERLRDVLAKRDVATSAVALTTFLVQDAALAQVPGTLGAGLMKLGLSGVGSGMAPGASASHALTTLLSGKLGWLGAAAVLTTAATIGVVSVTNERAPQPSSTATTLSVPQITVVEPAASGLPDPAFDRPLQPVLISGISDTLLQLAVKDDEVILYTRKPDIRWVYTIADNDPLAEPATIDLELVRIEGKGPISDQDRANIGKTRKAVYQFLNRGQCLIFYAGAFDGKRPRKIPKSFTENREAGQVLMASARSPEQAAASRQLQGDTTVYTLQGPWLLADQYYVMPAAERWQIFEVTNPEKPVGELEVKEWDVDSKPKRLGGVFTLATPQGKMVDSRKMIYEAGDDGVIRTAVYLKNSPFNGQYPKGFNDPREGLTLAMFVEYQP
ncbi:sigma-70 family RNA polymerase sigma factor [Algisphaera agarilytica]|uniref:RNA polymerase sigma factor (Sigma-70 family) n=1 Tax=Algisphaera agarilytica TaxID=1385975 RepID=A0A7X0H444_9BACT|nr:sigma-70 family RNA polymerase sigma factor [Algisphaera agarilytica]MBB6428933.1 RNA polymerase sigma factor (sigma-70 family) [Algisphaera agarilytica]